MISRRPSVRRLRPKASPVRTVGRRWLATYCPADLGVSQSNVGLEDRRIVGRRRSGSQGEARIRSRLIDHATNTRPTGRGQRLIADATEVPRLRLVESQPFRSGIVLLRYRTA